MRNLVASNSSEIQTRRKLYRPYRARDLRGPARVVEAVENKSFAVVVVTLIVLLALALWQFYLLTAG
jgi:hypothetical protein